MKGTEQLILIGAKSSGEFLRISQQTILVHARGLQDSVSRTRQRGWHDRAGGSRGCSESAQAAAACRCIQEARSSGWAVKSTYGGPGYRPLSSERRHHFRRRRDGRRRCSSICSQHRATRSSCADGWRDRAGHSRRYGRCSRLSGQKGSLSPRRRWGDVHAAGVVDAGTESRSTSPRWSSPTVPTRSSTSSSRASERAIPDRRPFRCSICTIPNLIGSSLRLVWA